MSRTLVIIPSISAVPDGNRMFVDIKALEGLMMYARSWPGPVRCLFRGGATDAIAFGTSIDPAAYAMELRITGDDPTREPGALDDAAVVLASGDNFKDLKYAQRLSVPVVYIIEYTIQTRLQIDRINNRLGLMLVKSLLWNIMTELKRRRAFKRAAGLQCNGTPAFSAYRHINTASLVYFDTRVPDALQIGQEQVEAKKNNIKARAPLRLVFSGRLEPMKGVEDLIKVAAVLQDRNLPFAFDVYGAGSLAPAMQAEINRLGLAERMILHGPVPFETALVPALIRNSDVFVCCHKQADPSCTYLETLSCGVPIVGYDNAAFRGILSLGDVGQAVQMNDYRALAVSILELAADRARLAHMIANAAHAGQQHSFEKVFNRRVEHLHRVSQTYL